MINDRVRLSVVFWRAVAEGAAWGVGAGALYANGCAFVTAVGPMVFGDEPASIGEIGAAVMYVALFAVITAAYGGALGLVAGLAAGVGTGLALTLTAKVQTDAASSPRRTRAVQRVVGAIAGAAAVAPLGMLLASWVMEWTRDTAPREVELEFSESDRLIMAVMFVVGPALVTAAVCAWRAPAIVRSGVRNDSLGTPEQRRAAVAHLDGAASASGD